MLIIYSVVVFIPSQLSERFNTLHGDVKLRWVTQPTKQEEDDDEDNGKCN